MASVSPLLGLGLAVAGVPKAITSGLQAGREQFNTEQTQKTNRELAQQQKQLMDFKLAEAGRADAISAGTQDEQTALLHQQLQAQQQQAKSLSNKIIKQDTFTALNNFFDSGDPRSLNQFFSDYKDDPTVQNMFKGVVKMEQINPSAPEDQKLLLAAGLSQEDLDAADGVKDGKVDWSKLKNRYVKAVRNDGETKITDMLHVASATGYGRYADDQKLAKMKVLADIQKTARGPAGSRDPNNTLTSLEKNARAVAAAQDRIDSGKGTSRDLELVKFGRHELGGVSTGKTDLANEARTEFKTAGLDSLSQAELQKNPKARRLVNEIELAHGISDADKKKFIDLNSMIALSSEAGKLNETQSGLYDKLTNNITNYTDQQIGGKKNRAAYGAFINQFRHELFGSALTDGELAAFKEAYSGLGQRIGPVLAGLRAALVQVKSQMQTLADFNDPIVIKFRTGKSQQEVKASLRGLDERIAFYDNVAAGMTPDQAAEKAKTQVQSSSGPQLGSDSSVDDVAKALGL